MVTKDDVVRDLLGRSTVKRAKAAKAALEVGGCICDKILQALQLELDGKHWKTKAALVTSLGILRCAGSEETLRSIVFSHPESEFDSVRRNASTALVRVARTSLEDCEVIWEILNTSDHSINEGALEAIGYDRMIFGDQTCAALIERCWDLGKDRPRGYTDPRYGLAAACAGWKADVSHAFLQHCLESDDVPLCYVAKRALRREYVKLR